MLKLRPVFDDVTFMVPVVTLHVGWVTEAFGDAGSAFGAALPVPLALVQPFTVAFTV